MKYERELLVPAVLCAVSFAGALLLAHAVGLSGTSALFAYYSLSAQATALVFLLWCGLPFLRQPKFRQLSPFRAAAAFLRERWMLLLLPLFLSPVFNTGYTMSKAAVPFLVGYHWDGYWTQFDRVMFGQDPWRLTHRLIGREGSRLLADAYTFGWGALFLLVPRLLLFFGPARLAIRFYTVRMLTWFVGGIVGASFLSSAGPIFAGLVDPELGHRFSPLRHSLHALLPRGDVILESQGFLRSMNGVPQAIEAAGISAMPSMHLATAALYVFLAWPTRWRVPAILFWLVMWIGSIHFGYHYAVDGLIGSLIAALMWKLTAPRGRLPAPVATASLCAPQRWRPLRSTLPEPVPAP